MGSDGFHFRDLAHRLDVHADFVAQTEGKQYQVAGVGHIEMQPYVSGAYDEERLAERAISKLQTFCWNTEVCAGEKFEQSAAGEISGLIGWLDEACKTGLFVSRQE